MSPTPDREKKKHFISSAWMETPKHKHVYDLHTGQCLKCGKVFKFPKKKTKPKKKI
jgi:nitrite reductase/ring-hydroxylating ferredoxin subunit